MTDRVPSKNQYLAPFLAGLLVVWTSFNAYAQVNPNTCGELKNHYGPFDYRTNRGETLDVVNRAHFTPKIEALVRDNTASIGGDLSYTLRTFPNHHRALMTMMRFGVKLKMLQPTDAEFTVECYFERALRFRPDDNIVRMMYASFLINNARIPEANYELGRVTSSAGDNAFTHYNAGLVYLDLKDYEKALEQAHRAMALGMPQTGLRDKLVELGKWQDPAQ